MLLFGEIASLIGLILASLEDLRTREVPDWLSFGMIFLGIGSALIFSIVESNYTILFNSVVGLLVTVAFAYTMFYTGQWGGGDSKLLMGLGALIGLDIFRVSEIPFLVILIINIFVIGAAYGLVWSLVLAIRKKGFMKVFKKHMYNDQVTLLRKINLFASAALLVAIILVNPSLKLILFGFMIFLYFSLYLWIFVRAVEECCMIKEVSVTKLTEGDWVVNNVVVKGKKICGPKDLGVKKEQIAELKRLKIRKVVIKEGVPFVPSFLLGFIATVVWGNWILLII